jgi:hypothetical protein
MTPVQPSLLGQHTPERNSPSSSLPPFLDTTSAVGAHSNIYRTPHTASASTSLSYSKNFYNTGSTDASSTGTSRKRTRHEFSGDDNATPLRESWTSTLAPSSSIVRSGGASSPGPLVNERYTLAGGLDSPTAAMQRTNTDYGMEGETLDRGYRARWEGASLKRGSEDDAPDYLMMAQDGRPVFSPGTHANWSKAVFGVVGGVAGKVWDFCRAGAFLGFQAGGGAGYKVKATQSTSFGEDSIWQEVQDRAPYRTSFEIPVPGRFPLDSDDRRDNPFTASHSQTPSTPPRPSKKVVREDGDGELKAAWVMVPPASVARSPTPSFSTPRKSGIPIATASGNKAQVSSAQSRIPSSKPSRRPILASRASLASFAGSPQQAGRASAAGMRSPVGATRGGTPQTPASVEAQRFAARIKREEREQDASIRKFNQQLKAMIQEGQAALETKIEIEMEEDDQEDIMDMSTADDDAFGSAIRIDRGSPAAKRWR